MELMKLVVLVLVAVTFVKVNAETRQKEVDGWNRPATQDVLLRFIMRQDRQYIAASPEEGLPVNCGHGNYCPAKHTCCRGHSGYWACCPLPKATCCPDGVHCCPFGYHCSLITRKCQKTDGDAIELRKKVPVIRIEPGNEARSQTPIAISEDERLDREVITKEGKDTFLSKERVAADQTPMAMIQEAVQVRVYCDSSHVCPAGNTCCRQHTGSWGCCPHLKATCCQDGLHCCPYGYQCSVLTNKCYRGDNHKIPILKNTPAERPPVDDIQTQVHEDVRYNPQNESQKEPQTSVNYKPLRNIQTKVDTKYVERLQVPSRNLVPKILPQRTYCNGTHYCPNNYTCCHSHFGRWSCCPGLQATCCFDGIHCCPRFLRCDVTRNKCVHDEGSATEWADTQPIERN